MRKRVLLVDDSATVRTSIQGALRDDFDCLLAADGSEGLKAALAEIPDAIVLDLEMPRMDGIQLLRAIKAEERTRSIPVVVVTSVTDVDKVNQCRSLGCAGFVLKPLDAHYLKVKLNRLLQPAPRAA